MTDLEEVYSSLAPKEQAVDDPVVGMYCTAKFTGMMSLLCNVHVNFNSFPPRGSPLMRGVSHFSELAPFKLAHTPISELTPL